MQTRERPVLTQTEAKHRAAAKTLADIVTMFIECRVHPLPIVELFDDEEDLLFEPPKRFRHRQQPTLTRHIQSVGEGWLMRPHEQGNQEEGPLPAILLTTEGEAFYACRANFLNDRDQVVNPTARDPKRTSAIQIEVMGGKPEDDDVLGEEISHYKGLAAFAVNIVMHGTQVREL